jgi:hypothetical protein
MSSERADDTARFMQAIAALSAAPEPVSELGRLISKDRQKGLESILMEITETVLRRQLTFRNEEGGYLTLDVAERRILRVVDLCNALGTAPWALPSPFLAPQHASETLRLLRRFQEKQSNIFVTIRQPDMPAPTGCTGVSVRDLEAAMEGAPAGTGLPEPLARALEICRVHASGAVTDGDGNVVTVFGSEDESAALSKVGPRFFEMRETDSAVHLWRWSAEPPKTVILAKRDGLCVSLVTSPSHMTACFNQLRSAFCSQD